MDAVLSGGSKINRATLDHGIPPSTLKVRLSSRKSFPRAHLLTSADSLALMEEKERKKQQEQEKRKEEKRKGKRGQRD